MKSRSFYATSSGGRQRRTTVSADTLPVQGDGSAAGATFVAGERSVTLKKKNITRGVRI
jgi:hypothetical protein